MKAQKFKIIALLIIAQILVITPTFAGDEEFSKNFHKEYEANSNTLLKVINKFGHIDINNWDKDIVQIDVTVTVDHYDEDKARELLSYINIQFSHSENTIKAITEINSKFSKWNSFSFGKNNKEFRIDFKIKMPKDIKLDISNKYGSVFIDEAKGHSKISVKYGNLKINKLSRENKKPLNEVYLAYSNGEINTCKWLNTTLKYSTFRIKEGKAIIAITRYSKLHVETASSIVSDSKYGEYKVGKVGNFVTDAAYTNFDFDEITKKIEIENDYGDIKIRHVPSGFEKIDVENDYGDVDIRIDSEASYQLKGYAKYANIRYPSESRVNRIKEGSSLKVNGLVGKDKNTKSKVVIETSYGGVNLH